LRLSEARSRVGELRYSLNFSSFSKRLMVQEQTTEDEIGRCLVALVSEAVPSRLSSMVGQTALILAATSLESFCASAWPARRREIAGTSRSFMESGFVQVGRACSILCDA
jgi:hypothetical protein